MGKKVIFPCHNCGSKLTKWLLINLSYIYIGLIIILPSINVFLKSFSNGIQPFVKDLCNPNFLHALKLTIIISIVVVPLNLIFGISMAQILHRYQFRGKLVILSILDLPFSISPIVTGLMITLLYSKNGIAGKLSFFKGAQILFALPGMILATAFITLPFIVREVVPLLEEIEVAQEEAAKTMGANGYEVFWRVTLPHIKWGLLYGLILTNARAMGEFGAVSIISGNILGKTQTLTLFIEQAHKDYQIQSAFSAALFLFMLASITILFKEILLEST
uniref:Sulfate transport system permease protein n=1 Tax=Gronococcus sybilensis TaxID=3028029 RepID=A0A9Y1I2F2_9RHOD|nr:sulfate transport system permease protein [Gronococcus sybilensis]